MQQFLAAFDGKGRDHQIAALGQGHVDLGLERGAAFGQRVVHALAPAIGAFAEDVVKAGRAFGLVVEHLLVRPDIAREHQADGLVAILHLNFNRS
ncbi:hypothetical protein D9M68_939100 [compost metagenome]